ncbi:MAG: hypothetical protein M1524_03145 [Patescibacteria group bacterium]|nr:hypothetical protein [Patescibacteria group bacterium]
MINPIEAIRNYFTAEGIENLKSVSTPTRGAIFEELFGVPLDSLYLFGQERTIEMTEGAEYKISRLSGTEKQVVGDRMGLLVSTPQTLDCVAAKIGRSPRTVGRIERQALSKLRGTPTINPRLQPALGI